MTEMPQRSSASLIAFLFGRLTLLSIAAQVVLTLGPATAQAGERIALVIGNGGYDHAAALAHVGSDTAVMADTLRSLDFDVEAANDLDRSSMQDHIESFGRRIDQAGKETIGLMFYAGHGFQLDGSNYLLPVDVAIETTADIGQTTINLDLALAEIAFATNDHKLVILDVPASPELGQGIGASPGLAPIDAPVGTLVAYGAQPGVVYGAASGANDRSLQHQGLYPLALANVMAKPGLMVEQVFQEVRLNVVEATDGLQIPWESSSLISPVYLAGPPSGGDGLTRSIKGNDEPIPQFNGLDPRTVDLVFWTSIKDSGDPDDFVDYLNSFPNGVFRTLAERRLDDLAGIDAAALEPRAPVLRIEELDERLITQKRANVRATPSSTGVIVATLEPDLTVEVTGDVIDSDWLRVRLGADIQAFIWKPLLGAEPPSADRQDSLAATLPPSRSALIGRWQGEYQCQWDTIGFTLDITDAYAAADDDIGAVFSFYPLPGAPSMPSGSFAMSGDYDPDDGTIILKGGDWIERPHGLQLHDIAGRAEIGGGIISGRVETPGCSDFHLARIDGQGNPTAQSIKVQ